MTELPEFEPFTKIPRLSREMVVTEKIDGTNAVVYVSESGEVAAGSRNRWITPEDDNYGFARWVVEHADELRELGPGMHYGEWWGLGIQRGYGLNEKRFSLFNVARWSESRPTCCYVVPVLARREFSTDWVNATLSDLRMDGSRAAPGFMRPEGVVVYHVASGRLFKKTIERDEAPKGTA